jgi:hypothetical protein
MAVLKVRTTSTKNKKSIKSSKTYWNETPLLGVICSAKAISTGVKIQDKRRIKVINISQPWKYLLSG